MLRNQILFPIITLALWTMMVLLLIPYRRFGAARRRIVSASDFLYGESANVPPEVSIPNRNLMNLLEIPVLFYVVCIVYYVTQKADSWAVNLAWVYVALRVVHSFIHLSYNKVEHRLVAYALSNFLLAALWIRLLLTLV